MGDDYDYRYDDDRFRRRADDFDQQSRPYTSDFDRTGRPYNYAEGRYGRGLDRGYDRGQFRGSQFRGNESDFAQRGRDWGSGQYGQFNDIRDRGPYLSADDEIRGRFGGPPGFYERGPQYMESRPYNYGDYDDYQGYPRRGSQGRQWQSGEQTFFGSRDVNQQPARFGTWAPNYNAENFGNREVTYGGFNDQGYNRNQGFNPQFQRNRFNTQRSTSGYDQDRFRDQSFNPSYGYDQERYGTSGRFDQYGEPMGMQRTEEWQRPGPFTGIGPRNYRRSDEQIRDDVCDRLTQNGGLDATDIDVSVNDGDVTLSGQVDDRGGKRLAEDITDSVPGVNDVHNQLKVRNPSWGQPGWYSSRAAAPTTGGTYMTSGPASQATRTATTTTSTAMNPRFQIAPGMDVVGFNGDTVGTVKEVHNNDFLLDRSMQRDLFVPFSAIQNVTSNRVVLNVNSGDLDNMGWENPPILGGNDQNQTANPT